MYAEELGNDYISAIRTEISRAKEGELEKKVDNPDNAEKTIDEPVLNSNDIVVLPEYEMPDHTKLFSYLGQEMAQEKQPFYDYQSGEDEEFENSELSMEEIERIIEQKCIATKFGIYNDTTTIDEKEAFKIYKLFNTALIEIKYEMCLY
mgnify:CR=1 FL=1